MGLFSDSVMRPAANMNMMETPRCDAIMRTEEGQQQQHASAHNDEEIKGESLQNKSMQLFVMRYIYIYIYIYIYTSIIFIIQKKQYKLFGFIF